MPLVQNVLKLLKNINCNQSIKCDNIFENMYGKKDNFNDNELIYSKNNVCVHSISDYDDNEYLHYPGYLKITVKTFTDQYNNVKRPTLFLDWIPNIILRNKESNFLKLKDDQNLSSNDSLNESFTSKIKCTNPFLLNDIDKKNSKLLTSNESDEEIYVSVNISSPNIKIVASPSKDTIDTQSTASDNSENTTQPYTTSSGFYSSNVSSSSIFLDKKMSNEIRCRRFSIDLSYMRSLRLFFSDESCTSGQLVILSRESQYKVLHFHHGGLDRFAKILHQWHNFLHTSTKNKNYKKANFFQSMPYRHFILMCRPEISKLELHPEEGKVPKLTSDSLKQILNDCGQIEDDLLLRKIVFFTGIERNLRKIIWPFLLQYYPYRSTYLERIEISANKKQEYDEINRRKSQLTGLQLTSFKHRIESVVEKDVVRSDRENPFFAGTDNSNLDKMKNILLNYAVYNSVIGYTQGMSDLLAPILCEIEDEVTTFWCFVGLMQKTTFIATPTDRDMDVTLNYLKELLKIMIPKFHEYINNQKDSSEFLFCHRWILLCFKREFTEAVALRMWEACWSNYLTDYFHLFLCLAIISIYSDDVISQNLKSDEILLYFSSLAMYMDGKIICQRARSLLYQFRQLREIPCTLTSLCKNCGPGIWDSSHMPRVYCTGHPECYNYCPNYWH